MRSTWKYVATVGLLVAIVAPAHAAPALVEPSLHLDPSPTSPRVALTLDACDGATDQRILSALIENGIPATIFVTAKWVKRNAASLATMRTHPDLFEIEDHGGRHVPAIDRPGTVYGLRNAGSPENVATEVESGAAAYAAAGGQEEKWFRGATAKYSPSAIRLIRHLGFKIAGYSVNGDGGSLLSARETERRVTSAKDGDVIIAHINQPTHAAGEGLVKGLLALRSKGFSFVRLRDVSASGSDGTTD